MTQLRRMADCFSIELSEGVRMKRITLQIRHDEKFHDIGPPITR